MSRPNEVKAYSGPYSSITRLADGAITEASVVKKGTNAKDVAEASAGDKPLGVVAADTVGTDKVEDNDQAEIVTSGIVRVEASAAVAQGEVVKAAASGKVQPTTGDGTDQANLHVGKALTSASQDGDVIEVAL